MDVVSLCALGAAVLTALGGVAALMRSRPENRKLAADASATVVGAATDLVTAQADALKRMSGRLDTLEAQAAEALQSRAELRREIDDLKGELATALHERDEAVLGMGILRKRVSSLEKELTELKASKSTPPE